LLRCDLSLRMKQWDHARSWKLSLTTTRATIVAQVFFVITRQPLQLHRCSNPLRMRKVFLVLLKKIFLLGWGVRLGWARKVGVFSVFWPTLTGPGRQSHRPKFCRKLFLETTRSPASIEPLLDLLACLEPTLWPKNPILPPKSENCRKCMSFPLAATVARDNSALEDASELYEPSKDSWSLLVCTEKKNILYLGSGFSVGGVRKRVVLTFFYCFIMTSSPPQRAKFLAQSLVGC